MNRTLKVFVTGLIVLGQSGLAMAGLFNVNDIMVVQIGDGGTPLDPGSQTVPVVINAYHPDAFQLSPALTLPLPSVPTASNPHVLTLHNNRAGGGLNRTTDGRYLVMGGTDIAPRVDPPIGSSAVRTIGRIDANGSIDTSTTLSDGYIGTTKIGIRSVASVDGSAYYLGGNGDGNNEPRYELHGGSSSTVLVTGQASRHPAISGGNLYLTQDAAVNQLGSGLPTSSTSIAALPGVGPVPTGGNWNSPVFFDLNPGVAGVDTLYLGVQRHSSNELPAIVKYTFNGSAWAQAYTLDLDSLTGMLFLTGRLEAGNVVLYGTTDNMGAPVFGNKLVKLTDLGAGSAFTTLATADSTHGFRGVAFAPVPEPAALMLVGGCLTAVALRRGNRRRAGKT